MGDDFMDALAHSAGFGPLQPWQQEVARRLVGKVADMMIVDDVVDLSRPPHFREESSMDFLEALDSIRQAVPDEAFEKVARAAQDRAEVDRALIGTVHHSADMMLAAKKKESRDRYEVHVWLVTLEVWDAMLRVADFKGRTPELRWEGIPVVPTNLDLPAGIALATLDPVTAAGTRLTAS